MRRLADIRVLGVPLVARLGVLPALGLALLVARVVICATDAHAATFTEQGGALTFVTETATLIHAQYETDDRGITLAHVWTSHDSRRINETRRVLVIGGTDTTIAWHGPGAWSLDTDARVAMWVPEGSQELLAVTP